MMASDQLQAQRLRRRLTARKPMATQVRKPRRRMHATLGAERKTLSQDEMKALIGDALLELAKMAFRSRGR